MRPVITLLLVLSTLATYLFVLVAVSTGLEGWFGLHWFIANTLALIIAFLPFVGSFIAAYAAVVWWDWSWLSAVLTLLAPFSIGIVTAWNGGRRPAAG